MGLSFRNNTSLTVYVAFAYYSSASCNQDSNPLIPWPSWYEAVGWYTINPGQTVEVLSGEVNNREIYYYAESSDRRLVWSGVNYLTLPQNAFKLCGGAGYCDAPLCRRLGLRKISIGNFRNYTVNIVSSNIQSQSKFLNVNTAVPGKKKNVGRSTSPIKGLRVVRPAAGRKSISKR
ncbi:DUF1036 domain-containing protein [Paenibacillus sp. FSL R5-0744]|uniref:DUF1036 domain-containing protein n=1 Tax=Paenibacillus sp. FSL R5-0744 TaxID=2921656 RepID=UPI0030DDB8E6